MRYQTSFSNIARAVQFAAIVLLLFVSMAPSYSITTIPCYYSANGTVWVSPPTKLVACQRPTAKKPIVNCCGAGDYCLTNGLCSNTYTFYQAPCTDPKYESDVCPRYCEHRRDQDQLDVYYNHTNNQWSCCIAGPPSTCFGLTSETFKAPPPKDLTIVKPHNDTNLPFPYPIDNPTPTPTASSNSASSGSPTSLILGIVFGVFGLIVSILGVWYTRKSYMVRKRNKQAPDAENKDQNDGSEPEKQDVSDLDASSGNGQSDQIEAAENHHFSKFQVR